MLGPSYLFGAVLEVGMLRIGHGHLFVWLLTDRQNIGITHWGFFGLEVCSFSTSR